MMKDYLCIFEYEIPTGRDYAYSDLRRQIQNMFKGME